MEFIEFRKRETHRTNRWVLTKIGLYIKNFPEIQKGVYLKIAYVEKSKGEQYPRVFFKVVTEPELNAFCIHDNSNARRIASTALLPFVQKMFNVTEDRLYLEPKKTIEGWTELEVFLKP